jgi:hypothetical protein
MESIEEQWNPPTSTDILSNPWTDIASAKKAVKIWIHERGESWAPSTQTIRLNFNYCLYSSCSFYIRVAQNKSGLFGVTTYTPHDCSPPTHSKFKQRNSAWYLASLVERDVTINRQIKPKEIRERTRIYHQLSRVPYFSASMIISTP